MSYSNCYLNVYSHHTPILLWLTPSTQRQGPQPVPPGDHCSLNARTFYTEVAPIRTKNMTVAHVHSVAGPALCVINVWLIRRYLLYHRMTISLKTDGACIAACIVGAEAAVVHRQLHASAEATQPVECIKCRSFEAHYDGASCYAAAAMRGAVLAITTATAVSTAYHFYTGSSTTPVFFLCSMVCFFLVHVAAPVQIQ